MSEVQTASITIASAGVFVAAIYYVLQIRNQSRMRQSDLLMRMHLAFSSKEYCDAALKVLSTDYKNYDEFIGKYGQPFAEGPVQSEFLMMAMFFEGIGILAKRKLVDMSLVAELFDVNMGWEKARPMVEGLRKQLNTPKIYEWFEYLANETKKIQASKKA
jgi:hypothetical protein